MRLAEAGSAPPPSSPITLPRNADHLSVAQLHVPRGAAMVGATRTSGRPVLSTVGIVRRVSFDLAQVNVSRLLAPLDSPRLAPFMGALEEVNALGDAAPGFVWRLQTEDGNATAVQAFGWDVGGSHGVIVNLTTWTSVQALADFVFSGRHLEIMRQRRQWFHNVAEATTALWWVPGGHRPSTAEAEDRVRMLRREGPSPAAFTFRTTFPAPGQGRVPTETGNDWFCPA